MIKSATRLYIKLIIKSQKKKLYVSIPHDTSRDDCKYCGWDCNVQINNVILS